MSLEDRDWYRQALAEREGKAPSSRAVDDYQALFEQRQQRFVPVRPVSAGWSSVFGVIAFVAVAVGLGVWALRVFR